MNTIIIACEVFRDELARLGVPASSIHFLEMGLHDHPDLLTQHLQALIVELEAREQPETILLAYGYCGGGMVGVQAHQARLVVPRAHDCIAVFMGDNRRYESEQRENPGTYYFSPGWLKGGRVPGEERVQWLREMYADKYDEETIEDLIEADQEMFAAYHTACYVDTAADPQCSQRCQQCATQMHWKFRTNEATLDWLQQLIKGPYSEDRFLVIQPGETVVTSSTGTLMSAVKA